MEKALDLSPDRLLNNKKNNQVQKSTELAMAYIQPFTYSVFSPSRFHIFFVLSVGGSIDSQVARQRPVRPMIRSSIPGRSIYFYILQSVFIGPEPP